MHLSRQRSALGLITWLVWVSVTSPGGSMWPSEADAMCLFPSLPLPRPHLSCHFVALLMDLGLAESINRKMSQTWVSMNLSFPSLAVRMLFFFSFCIFLVTLLQFLNLFQIFMILLNYGTHSWRWLKKSFWPVLRLERITAWFLVIRLKFWWRIYVYYSNI